MNEVGKSTVRWLGGLSLIVGLWVLVSPFVLGINSNVAFWNLIVSGGLVTLLALGQLYDPERSWPSWVNLLVALWLVAFPYMFNPPEAAAYNNAVWSGLILGVIALVDALTVAAVDRGMLRHRSM